MPLNPVSRIRDKWRDTQRPCPAFAGRCAFLEIYVMCEIPYNVISIDAFAELFDGFSIGSAFLRPHALVAAAAAFARA